MSFRTVIIPTDEVVFAVCLSQDYVLPHTIFADFPRFLFGYEGEHSTA